MRFCCIMHDDAIACLPFFALSNEKICHTNRQGLVPKRFPGSPGLVRKHPFGEKRGEAIAGLRGADDRHVRRADDGVSVPLVGGIETGDVEQPRLVLKVKEHHALAAGGRREAKPRRVAHHDELPSRFGVAYLVGG